MCRFRHLLIHRCINISFKAIFQKRLLGAGCGCTSGHNEPAAMSAQIPHLTKLTPTVTFDPTSIYSPWRRSDFRTGRLEDERFPSFLFQRLTMPRRELLHSSLYDSAKWRESLIYTKTGPRLFLPN